MERLQDERKAESDDYQAQIEALEKQLKSNKHFLDVSGCYFACIVASTCSVIDALMYTCVELNQCPQLVICVLVFGICLFCRFR